MKQLALDLARRTKNGKRAKKAGRKPTGRRKADPYSTGPAFFGDAKDLPPLPVVRASCWLLGGGLARARPISPYERPTSKPPDA